VLGVNRYWLPIDLYLLALQLAADIFRVERAVDIGWLEQLCTTGRRVPGWRHAFARSTRQVLCHAFLHPPVLAKYACWISTSSFSSSWQAAPFIQCLLFSFFARLPLLLSRLQSACFTEECKVLKVIRRDGMYSVYDN